MKKIAYICDCCGKDATENYYTIDIYQHSDSLGKYTAAGASNNLENNTRKILGKEKIYCQDCVDFIQGKLQKNNRRK